MKASFPPFASCFPPRSGFASPALICDQRATGARGWVRKSAAIHDRWRERPPKGFSLRRGLWASVQTGYCKLSRRVSHADYHQLSRRIRAYRRSPAVTQDSHISTAASHRDGLQHVPNAPVARRCNRRGRAQHGHRGNIQGDGWRLRRSGHAEFSLPRVHAAMSPFGLTQLTFTSQTGSLLLSSLKKVTFPPSSLSPPSVTFSLSPDRPRCSAGRRPPACPRRESGASGAFAARTAG